MNSEFPFFSSPVQKSSSKGCLRYFLMGVLLLVFLIISFIIPKTIGPWWMWSAFIAGLAAFVTYTNYKNKGTIELFKAGPDEIKMRLKIDREEIIFSFAPTAITYWFRLNYYEGAVNTISYFCSINGMNGKEISLQQVSGGKAEQPADWNHIDEIIPEGESFFLESKMTDFVDVIRKFH